jgi:amino acid transporter
MTRADHPSNDGFQQPTAHGDLQSDDHEVRLLNSLGYGQELLRRMSGFSNFAISLSIICILAGCITSFPQGLSSVGGAAIGLGWPACCLISLCAAATMAQLASAFPTAGGLYHWAAILGGRGWGWLTAWFNLAGLITVLAAINVGTYQFGLRVSAEFFSFDPARWDQGTVLAAQVLGVLAITSVQALLNHLGIRVTAALTDFSGYWILFVASVLTAALLAYASALAPERLITCSNFSGSAGGTSWPPTSNLAWLFLLRFLLPAYTVTGFDATAHTAEETVAASHHVPRGIVRSVLVSGLFGWAMLCAVVLAAPDVAQAASHGPESFHWIVGQVLPQRLWSVLAVAIVLAQFFCGLATVTSASRMAYAFARDGGLPFSNRIRHVSTKYRTPAFAIWLVSLLSVAFVVHARAYSTITGACTIFLYISYVIPTALGLVAIGRTWTRMGPWDLGAVSYRVLAVLSIAGCLLILAVGVQPPNEQNVWTVLGAFGLTAIVWAIYERRHFRGPPPAVLTHAAAPKEQSREGAEQIRTGR